MNICGRDMQTKGYSVGCTVCGILQILQQKYFLCCGKIARSQWVCGEGKMNGIGVHDLEFTENKLKKKDWPIGQTVGDFLN